ncbi:MAG: hypothetical protein EA356_16310 [Geminicoccaceae bacterium]|nr:MAG: hypothetical protein EA356_16310 [Geminicoccaceae bacterium]
MALFGVGRSCAVQVAASFLNRQKVDFFFPGVAHSAVLRADGVELQCSGRAGTKYVPFADLAGITVEMLSQQTAMRLIAVHFDGIDGERQSLAGIAEAKARVFRDVVELACRQWCRQRLEAHAHDLRAAVQWLDRMGAAAHYVPRHRWTPHVDSLVALLQALPRSEAFLADAADAVAVGALRRLRAFVGEAEAVRDALNRRYLDHAVETAPLEARLTPSQRRAVLTDEDRTLVVAPAGSGKTAVMAVMAAKIEHLLKAGQRTPGEVLAVTFTKKAAGELAERLQRRGVEGVKVSTIDALGLGIIGEALGAKPPVGNWAADAQAQLVFLNETIERLISSDVGFARRAAEWNIQHFRAEHSIFDFGTYGDYFAYLKAGGRRTLQGEHVRSFEEAKIANFLALHGIAYQYEKIYPHVPRSPYKKAYQPDFYLDQFGIWIEHFAVDDEDRTPSFIDGKKYLEERDWKRAQHQQYGSVLVETTSGENAAGVLLPRLREKLQKLGVTFAPLPAHALIEKLRADGRIVHFARLAQGFLAQWRHRRLAMYEVRSAYQNQERHRLFLELFGQVLGAYEQRLQLAGEIDFADMVQQAADQAEPDGYYRSPYRTILIDEFQDVTAAQFRLITGFLRQRDDAQLFAVGDDWQSIYRFNGADVSIINDFERRVAPAGVARVAIEETFRSVAPIAAVAQRFVRANPRQSERAVVAVRAAEPPRVTVCFYQSADFEHSLRAQLGEVAARLGAGSVLVLARYHRAKPAILAFLQKTYPGLDLDFATIHQAKGLEADCVIVLGLRSGSHGFPTEIDDDPVMDMVLPDRERFAHAEERRLFYVALTRARDHVWVMADAEEPSTFALELARDPGVLVTGDDPQLGKPCPLCSTGRLAGTPMKCSNAPLCPP